MRVSVDRDACTGHGRCYALAPDVYAPDDDGYCTIATPEVPAGLEDQARRGAMNCPEDAISVLDDDGRSLR